MHGDLPVGSSERAETIQSYGPDRRLVSVLPVRQTVLFPFAILPLGIGRDRSIELVNEVLGTDRVLAVFAQRDSEVEVPGPGDLHEVGTLAVVVRMLQLPEAGMNVLAQGVTRVRIVGVESTEPYIRAWVEPLEEHPSSDIETEALMSTVQDQLERIVSLDPQLPVEVVPIARGTDSPGRLADFVAATSGLAVETRQALLEELDVKTRLRSLVSTLAHQTQVLEVEQRIRADVKEAVDEHRREALLRQQLDAIHRELGDADDPQREVDELRARLDRARPPEHVRKEADRELGRLARTGPQSPEGAVIRTYVEWLADMPWSTSTEDDLDLRHARSVLDEDHHGLEKVKERVLEYLAIRRFRPDARSPILCFVGPPGTGKTSLGRSIARAMGRQFVRQSLGGLRDEAEVRGHRRTYIGAMPGSIIQGVRRAGTRNPLFMLDEIDKLGVDFRGDPASALLEVLDPEQNSGFVDHYLDVPFDLSRTLFICTANILDPVPPALRDRMEVIVLSGYTDLEKLAIAARHLVPRAIADSGLGLLGLEITDDAILEVAREYTSEAGLRNLERELQHLLRKTAKAIAEGVDVPRRIDAARVFELLGAPPFPTEPAPLADQPGTALGLAWTPAGGEVLVIEATAMPGRHQVLLTGKLGEVMKESALAALSYIRTNASSLGIDPTIFDRTDIHLHLPSGAIPKDGPSAGTALCTALVSLLTHRRTRPGVAMTGEITLLGRILAVGGIKEKVLAADRAGVRTVILPHDNERDLEDIPAEVRERLGIVVVDRLEQVLAFALGES